VKFEVTEAFRADRRRLSAKERRLVDERLPAFVEACDRYAEDPSTAWPSALRVKDIENAPGIWEVTFSFSGPDIRATFEWITIDAELAVRWRRIGGHEVFKRP
jgi:hypothetical protein